MLPRGQHLTRRAHAAADWRRPGDGLLCRRFGLSSPAGRLCGCAYLGQWQAKCHFNSYEVGANCVVLDCAMCVAGGYAIFVGKTFAFCTPYGSFWEG